MTALRFRLQPRLFLLRWGVWCLQVRMYLFVSSFIHCRVYQRQTYFISQSKARYQFSKASSWMILLAWLRINNFSMPRKSSLTNPVPSTYEYLYMPSANHKRIGVTLPRGQYGRLMPGTASANDTMWSVLDYSADHVWCHFCSWDRDRRPAQDWKQHKTSFWLMTGQSV